MNEMWNDIITGSGSFGDNVETDINSDRWWKNYLIEKGYGPENLWDNLRGRIDSDYGD